MMTNEILLVLLSLVCLYLSFTTYRMWSIIGSLSVVTSFLLIEVCGDEFVDENVGNSDEDL